MFDRTLLDHTYLYRKVLGGRKLTRQQAAIFEQLLVKPCWGYEIKMATGIRLGTIYENLNNFSKLGVVQEELLPGCNAPPRKVYRLTDQGVRFAAHMLENFRAEEAIKNQDTPTGELL